MKKEEKTDMLLAFLAQVIADGNNQKQFPHPPCVIFLSSTEVQIIEQTGNMPTNKEYPDNPLRKTLEDILEAYYKDEEKYYLELWLTDNLDTDIPDGDFDIDLIYDSTYMPILAFHRLYILKKLLSR